MIASLCVYHGGMALNDWADREEDARGGRGRPIPSGAISARAALLVAAVLLCAGPVLGLFVSVRAGLALAAVAALATLYDLRGRGPWLGPTLLGLCRAGNLGAGVLFGRDLDAHGGREALALPGLSAVPGEALAVVLYGLYVFHVSRVARLEDVQPSELAAQRPGRGLLLAGVLLVVLGTPRLVLALPEDGAVATSSPMAGAWAGALLATAGAFALVKRGLRSGPWSPGEVGASVGMALRRLLVATAALASQAGTRDGLVVAAAILCGYPLSYLLRRVFPPT